MTPARWIVVVLGWVAGAVGIYALFLAPEREPATPTFAIFSIIPSACTLLGATMAAWPRQRGMRFAAEVLLVVGAVGFTAIGVGSGAQAVVALFVAGLLALGAAAILLFVQTP
jgi:hypothetical protein